MVEKTTTRASISDVVHYKIGLSRTESARMVDLVIEEICNALASGQDVKLSGFGSFNIRSKNPRIGRNPKTLEEVLITPRRVLSFSASANLKDAVVLGMKKKTGRSAETALLKKKTA